jgi:hypothetical protein
MVVVFFANKTDMVHMTRSQDSSVGIATELRLEEREIGLRFPARARDFSLLHNVHTGSGTTQPPIQWVPGALSPRVKRPGCKADESPPSSVEVNNDGALPPF